MSRLLAAIFLYLGLTVAASAQSAIQATTQFQIPIAGTVASATKIVSGIAGKRIYITALALVPASGAVVTLTTGTGTNCGTNTASVTGAMTFGANPLSLGDGSGAVFVIPTGNDLCITIATAAAPGSLAYAQF